MSSLFHIQISCVPYIFFLSPKEQLWRRHTTANTTTLLFYCPKDSSHFANFSLPTRSLASQHFFLHILVQWILGRPDFTTNSHFSLSPLLGSSLCFVPLFCVLRHSDLFPVSSPLCVFVHVTAELFFTPFLHCPLLLFSSQRIPPPPLPRSHFLHVWGEAPCLWVGLDQDLCHESLLGDPWHSAVPLLSMQGMLAPCTSALMKGLTHWEANSRTLISVMDFRVLTKKKKKILSLQK